MGADVAGSGFLPPSLGVSDCVISAAESRLFLLVIS